MDKIEGNGEKIDAFLNQFIHYHDEAPVKMERINGDNES